VQAAWQYRRAQPIFIKASTIYLEVVRDILLLFAALVECCLLKLVAQAHGMSTSCSIRGNVLHEDRWHGCCLNEGSLGITR